VDAFLKVSSTAGDETGAEAPVYRIANQIPGLPTLSGASGNVASGPARLSSLALSM
jgi:hypothetical protein